VIHQIVFILCLFPLTLLLIILTIAEEDASTEKEADDSLTLFARDLGILSENDSQV
jgi:hypothetical protein